MTNVFSLQITTPEETLFSGEIASLKVPAYDGNLGILSDHAPMLCMLQSGTIEIRNEEQQDSYFSITGGFLEVQSNEVIILADACETAEEIDVDRARNAYSRAAKRLYQQAEDDDLNQERAEKSLQRAEARLKTAQKAGKSGASIPEVLS